MPLSIQFPRPAYPFTSGYADTASVVRLISAGSWDPTMPNAYPTTDMVNSYLVEATAVIDAALASRGYAIPLTPQQGYVVPTGLTPINGLHPGVYVLMQHMAASFAASRVETSRHAFLGVDTDDAAITHMKIFDDFIVRIEDGSDKLAGFGVTGPFEPELDPSKGFTAGTLGAFVQTSPSPDPQQESSLFTRASTNFGDIF